MNNQPHHRPHPIRSYVIRKGKITNAQSRALECHAHQYILKTDQDIKKFATQQPLYIEIGFGYGEATWQIAAANPTHHYLAIEVHSPGIGALINHLHKNNISNVKIVQNDAIEVIANHITDNSVSGVHLFYPDPWQKKRHHKRRIISAPFIDLLSKKLVAGGYIYCITDWQDYATHIAQTFSAAPQFTPCPPPYKNLSTGFARRATREGRPALPFCYTKLDMSLRAPTRNL